MRINAFTRTLFKSIKSIFELSHRHFHFNYKQSHGLKFINTFTVTTKCILIICFFLLTYAPRRDVLYLITCMSDDDEL